MNLENDSLPCQGILGRHVGGVTILVTSLKSPVDMFLLDSILYIIQQLLQERFI